MAYILLILSNLFWSGNFVVGRRINDIIPPVALAFWRWTIALLILLPFALKRLIHQRELIKQHWKLMAFLALPSVTIFPMFIYLALQSITVVNTALINSFMPILIVLASWISFRERITLKQGVGILLSLTGLLWILSRGNPMILLSVKFSTGDLWTLSADVAWAVYSVMLRKRPSHLDPICFLAVLIIFGAIFLIPFYIWELHTEARIQYSMAIYGSILYVAFFPSILSYLFWNRAVAIVGANKAGIFIHLLPIFSIILAFVFLGERLSFYHLLGMVLIFSGIFLTTIEKLQTQP